ncbi:MAG: asparaginase [Bacteroidia bacterium]|nr:asparaginase [Bacteroidia bacterium]HQV01185.1 asparaginase [Bacteroidia bacterium]
MQKILIIYTGGTIGMTYDTDLQTLVPFDFGKIYDRIPELKRFNCKIDFYTFHPLIDSSDMQPKKWVLIAKHIYKHYDEYSGFIILHGTDTMSYTASALSFMLENLSKPVILTGSQLPLEAVRTDARTNLITAIEIVSTHKQYTDGIKEVCIFFDNELYRGNRTEKYTSSKFDAFKSANFPILAEAGVHIIYHEDNFLRWSKKQKFRIDEKLNDHIALLKLYPGITQNFIETVLKMPQLRGVVIESYGAGNAPTNKTFIDALQEAISSGIVMVNVSQCSGGSVELGKYESSTQLQQIGVISGGDMTTESALTKLMYLFGKGLRNTQVEKFLVKNLRGELTVIS